MGQIVFSWDTFHNIPALEVWLKNLVCSFVFPILPLFYPNMVCEQLPNPIRIARKCLMCIKNLQYLSGFTYHLYLLTCFCYHSAMFAACEKSFVWGSVFTSFSIFLKCFRLLDKHSRRSNPFFFITKSEVWVVFMVCFFFKGRFWDISSILSDFFFVSLCAFVFEYVFQSICDLMYIISLYPIMSLQNGRQPSSAWEVGLSLMLIFAQVVAKQSEIRQSLCFLLFSHHALQNDVTSPLPSAYKMGQHWPFVIFLKGFNGRIQDCSSL